MDRATGGSSSKQRGGGSLSLSSSAAGEPLALMRFADPQLAQRASSRALTGAAVVGAAAAPSPRRTNGSGAGGHSSGNGNGSSSSSSSLLDARARDSDQAFAAYAQVAALLSQDQKQASPDPTSAHHWHHHSDSPRAMTAVTALLSPAGRTASPRRAASGEETGRAGLRASGALPADEGRHRRRVSHLASPPPPAPPAQPGPSSPAPVAPAVPPLHTPRRSRASTNQQHQLHHSFSAAAATSFGSMSPAELIAHYGGGGGGVGGSSVFTPSPAAHIPPPFIPRLQIFPPDRDREHDGGSGRSGGGGGGGGSDSGRLGSSGELSSWSSTPSVGARGNVALLSPSASPRYPLVLGMSPSPSSQLLSPSSASTSSAPSLTGTMRSPRASQANLLLSPSTSSASISPPFPPSSTYTPRRGLSASASSASLDALMPLPPAAITATAATTVAGSPASASPGAASVFCATAPSSFVMPIFNPCEYYASRCAVHGLPPNGVLVRMLERGLAARRVWDCGFLYLGARGLAPLLDLLERTGGHVQELSLRGAGVRPAELARIVSLVRAGVTAARGEGVASGGAPPTTAQLTAMAGASGGPRFLRTLDLGDSTSLSESSGAQLLLLVNLAPALTRLHLDGTRVDEVTQRAIASACEAKLAARPSKTMLAPSARRYAKFAANGNGNGSAAPQLIVPGVEEWKRKLLEGFMRKSARAALANDEAEEARQGALAAQRERDKQSVRLLLRCLQTDNDITGLLSRFDQDRHPEVWRDVRVVRRFVKRLIETGHHRKAFELADQFVNPKPGKAIAAAAAAVAAAAAATTKGNAGGPASTSLVAQPVLPPPNFASDEVLQWWRVYALARSRNFTDAFKEINLLLESPVLSLAPSIQANLLGLAGMLRKCMYESGARADHDSVASALQEEDANESAQLYLKSYETAHGLMEGVAAATMMRLANKDVESSRLARRLLKEASAELALLNRTSGGGSGIGIGSGGGGGGTSGPGGMGLRSGGGVGGGGAGGGGGGEDLARKLELYSALAEANINLQRPNAAFKYYQAAVEAAGAGGNVNHLSQLQQNLLLLSNKRVRIGDVMQLFHAGNVAVFVGFAVDHPLHDLHSFPPERDVELEISYQLELLLEAHQVAIGFCSLSCGSEILFAEKMLERRCELHVVLPFHLEDFFSNCVDYGLASMSKWKARAQAVLKKCEVHYVTSERGFPSDMHVMFSFQALIMEGLALIRARELGVGHPVALAVLDTAPVFSSCRPNRFVRSWKAKKAATGVIDLQDVRRRVLHAPGAGGGAGSSLTALAPRGTVAHRYSDADHPATASAAPAEIESGLTSPVTPQVLRVGSGGNANGNGGGNDGYAQAWGSMTTPASANTAAEADTMFTAKPPPLHSASEHSPALRHRMHHLHSSPTLGAVSSASAAASPSSSPLLPAAGTGSATMQHATNSSGKFLTAIQFASRIARVVKYMMFADIESTETIAEEHTPVFFKTFFKLLEKARKESRVSPFYANTYVR